MPSKLRACTAHLLETPNAGVERRYIVSAGGLTAGGWTMSHLVAAPELMASAATDLSYRMRLGWLRTPNRAAGG
jgi:hypothetical protein